MCGVKNEGTDGMGQVPCDPNAPPKGTVTISCHGEKQIATTSGRVVPSAWDKYLPCGVISPDAPWRDLDYGDTFHWSMWFVGIVWDTCYLVERSARLLFTQVSGPVVPPKEAQVFRFKKS